MSWSIGFDSNWNRDIGYGVPAFCDYPGCGKEIDRGLGYVCGGEPYGGDIGCGLYFCGEHKRSGGHRDSTGKVQYAWLCPRCTPRVRKPYTPTPDHPLWTRHKLTHPSWAKWREENPELVEKLRDKIGYTLTLDITDTHE